MRWFTLSPQTSLTLIGSLLCGLSMTGCCGKKGSTRPDVVVVEQSAIRSCADVEQEHKLKPGTLGAKCYVVTGGWMIKRLEAEQGLRAALSRCEGE